MSYRNSFCTEYIYNKEDEETLYKKLSQHWEVNCNNHIISGFIKSVLCGSTPWDLKEALDRVRTNQPITFVTISENGNCPDIGVCTLINGDFKVVYSESDER